eukprot:COSAG06_NODE_53868_length_297_cov_1.313131_1_plen_57_part_10
MWLSLLSSFIAAGSLTFGRCFIDGAVGCLIVLATGHSFQADFWALGVTIYEMLTGKT